MKLVINASIGGYLVSKKLFDILLKAKVPGAIEEEELRLTLLDGDYDYQACYIERDDPELIKAVELLGDKAGGSIFGGKPQILKIIEIPDDIEWYIDDLEDGREIIREQHRIWR